MTFNIDNLKEEDIVYFGERAEPYFCSHALIFGMHNKERSLEFFGIKNIVRWIQLNYYFYQFVDDLKLVEDEAKEILLRQGNKYVDRLIDGCIRAGNDLLDYSIRLGNSEYFVVDRKKMAEDILNYHQAFSNYTIFFLLTYFERPLTELAEEVLKRNTKSEDEAKNIFNLIFITDRLTAAEYEQDDFLRIATSLKEDWDEMAKMHAEKYGWLAVRYFLGNSWEKDDVLLRLSKTDRNKAEAELTDRISHRKKMEEMIMKTIVNFSDEDKEVVVQIRKIIYLRTQRGDFVHESASRVRPFLDNVARELGVSYFDLLNLSAFEIKLALEDKIDYRMYIDKRKKNFLIYHNWGEDGGILEGKDVEDYISTHLFLRTDIKNVFELSGKTGYKGNIKGIVKIVKNNNDIVKVLRGNIIVTTMTTANLMPAMEKASAFITDEGGITCHAAIIAREMKKPCIIGTKIATKVLKDGDEVEVDADSGIVKIIKRKE